MLELFLFGAICLLAYANGANDNFKGVASLFGSDTTHYRGAIAWGTVTTLAGSVASIFLAQALLQAFSGKGLVPAEVASGQLFVLAVAVGAGGTVLLATLLGFPISTTHGLVGAIVGAGFLAAGSALNVRALTTTFVLPLVASPFMALVLAAALYGVLHRARTRLGIRKEMCLCVGEPVRSVVPIAGRVRRHGGAGWAGLARLSGRRAADRGGRGHSGALRGALHGPCDGHHRPAAPGRRALPQRGARELRARPQRHTQDRRAAPGDAGCGYPDGRGSVWRWPWAVS